MLQNLILVFYFLLTKSSNSFFGSYVMLNLIYFAINFVFYISPANMELYNLYIHAY